MWIAKTAQSLASTSHPQLGAMQASTAHSLRPGGHAGLHGPLPQAWGPCSACSSANTALTADPGQINLA